VTLTRSMREKHDGALADQMNVRLWLRLLSCTMVVEKRLKRRLADQFDATLPRFDVLAALDRHPDGMTMGELSSSLLVSNGNVTALVRTLEKDGHVSMAPSPTDRRASVVRLTEAGQAHFAGMARAHHEWIEGMMSGISRQQREMLFDLLGALKLSIAGDDHDRR
jgi:DNA-binding MarR family transcriptional regulator